MGKANGKQNTTSTNDPRHHHPHGLKLLLLEGLGSDVGSGYFRLDLGQHQQGLFADRPDSYLRFLGAGCLLSESGTEEPEAL